MGIVTTKRIKERIKGYIKVLPNSKCTISNTFSLRNTKQYVEITIIDTKSVNLLFSIQASAAYNLYWMIMPYTMIKSNIQGKSN